jgi:ABC-type antimicrobial peptide transport system permease subunit
VYQPHATSPLSRPFFVVHTDADAVATADRMRAAIRSVDSDVPISRTISMQDVLDDAVAVRRFQMNLVTAFAIVALLLAAVGIYGVVSFTVVQTTPEIGIRMALGAHRKEVLTMIVRRGLAPVAAGLTVGIAGAIVTSRVISNQLYGVMPDDLATLTAVTALVLSISVCACWIPARRATKISPLRALRSE